MDILKMRVEKSERYEVTIQSMTLARIRKDVWSDG